MGVIYVQKGIELLVYEFDTGNGQAGWLACMIAILFALAVYFVEGVGMRPFGRESPIVLANSSSSKKCTDPPRRLAPPPAFWFRKFIMDYSFAAAIIFFTGFVHMCV